MMRVIFGMYGVIFKLFQEMKITLLMKRSCIMMPGRGWRWEERDLPDLIPPQVHSSFHKFIYHIIVSFIYSSILFLFSFGLLFIHSFIHSFIYLFTYKSWDITNKQLQFTCSLDPPNQGWLFCVVGPKLINDTEHNWLHKSIYVFG